MKRFLFTVKIFFLLSISTSVIYIKNKDFIHQVYETYHYDTFNVFHWKHIRFTNAEPNKNFVKTRYILHNKKKFNAFIFGSSRVGRLPVDGLPQNFDGTKLNWYNMTHSEGIPAEHLLTMKTFLKNGVKINMVLLGFDNISMYASLEAHKAQLLRIPFQVYAENKIEFFRPYFEVEVNPTIIKQIDEYDFNSHKEQAEDFYDYGWNGGDFSLAQNPDMGRYKAGHRGYPLKDSYKDLEAIVTLCNEYGIKLILFTSPLYESLYRNSIEDGYFDFLRKVAQKCEFYNFSTLNKYTTDPRYYFEWSHYRPILGLAIEKVLFGTDEEREEIRNIAGDNLFGVKISAQNIDDIITKLQNSHIVASNDA